RQGAISSWCPMSWPSALRGADVMTSRRKRPLSPAEEALWKAATKGDQPIDRKNVFTPPEAPRPRRRPMVAHDTPEGSFGEDFGALPRASTPGASEMDGNLAAKLKRGQLPIDGAIDLHGMTLRDAEDRLNRYVAGAVALGSRVIL